MYAEKGHKVTVDYTDSGSGAFSEIEVFTENEIPFAFSVMLDSKSFQTVAQKWNGGIFIDANYKPIVLTDKNENICFLMPSGVGKEGFVNIEYDFHRSNMISYLDYQKEEEEPQTATEEARPEMISPAPVQIDPINLPVIASEYKYNAMGLYFLLSLLCDLCKAIIYNEAKEALKRLKMLLSSPVVNVEDFANEVQIIDLKPDEIEEIKRNSPDYRYFAGCYSSGSGECPGGFFHPSGSGSFRILFFRLFCVLSFGCGLSLCRIMHL